MSVALNNIQSVDRGEDEKVSLSTVLNCYKGRMGTLLYVAKHSQVSCQDL